jgi:diadenosine tetraphosphatase ApaH/serine/threonine PP2A family protein phosphatase
VEVRTEPDDPDDRGGMIVNIGSLGQPRDGDPRLSFVLFDGRSVTFVRLDYDHDRTAEEIRCESRLPNYLAERLAVGR